MHWYIFCLHVTPIFVSFACQSIYCIITVSLFLCGGGDSSFFFDWGTRQYNTLPTPITHLSSPKLIHIGVFWSYLLCRTRSLPKKSSIGFRLSSNFIFGEKFVAAPVRQLRCCLLSSIGRYSYHWWQCPGIRPIYTKCHSSSFLYGT